MVFPRGFDPFEPIKRDINRITRALGAGPLPIRLLPKWTETRVWEWHGVAYGYAGEVLGTDDFLSEPPHQILTAWAELIARQQYGAEGGWHKMPVSKIVITGPGGYKRTWHSLELVPH